MENNVDISVTFAGVKMRSPIGIGAVALPMINRQVMTPEIEAETLLKQVEAGAGYICLPASNHVPKEWLDGLKEKAEPYEYTYPAQPYKFMRMETKGFGLDGLYYTVSTTYPPEQRQSNFERIRKIVDILNAKKPADVPLIANNCGMGGFPETFASTAKIHEEAGVDMIEINLGCGLPSGIKDAEKFYSKKNTPLVLGGVLVGDHLDLVEEITREVVKAVKIPVGVKLSPETGFPRIIEMARRIKKAGGKFINCSNNAVVIPPPDIYNGGKGKWPFIDENFFCAGSGNLLRQIVYKQVAAISKFVPGIDVMCTGGLVVPEHIIEAMMLGARSTQFVTGMLYEGRTLIKRYVGFLSKYMKEQGYESTSDFTGLGLNYIKPVNEVDFKPGKLYAQIDSTRCNGCGRCANQLCLATYIENGVSNVDVEKCIGCGMCVALCPQGAATLYERT